MTNCQKGFLPDVSCREEKIIEQAEGRRMKGEG
jgi:hypothetical protein